MTWKKIDTHPNYSVSDAGEVRNDVTGRLKTLTRNKANGYLYVDLYKDNVGTKAPVHRLVAEAFAPKRDGAGTVDHADGDRTNNTAENLRWATYSEQNSRFETRGVRSEAIIAVHFAEERKRRGGGHIAWGPADEVLTFERITDAAEHFGVTLGNISLMLDKGTVGRRGRMRGYQFGYVDGGRSRRRGRVTTIESTPGGGSE